MQCEVCGKVCADSLMLARHVARSTGHERMETWTSSLLDNLRSSLKSSGRSAVALTKAMDEGWDYL